MLERDNQEYLNIIEISNEIGLDPETILQYITSGRLKAYEIDNVYYSTSIDLKAFQQHH